MGNTVCCQNNINGNPLNKEISTERSSEEKNLSDNNKNNKNTNIPKLQNKIMTEGDDNLDTYNINLHNFNIQSKLISTTNNNEEEILERISYLRRIVVTAPRLNLEIINSNVLPQGIILKINALGMENSLRGIQDGYTYFGFQEDISNPIVDYIIRPKDQDYDNRYIGRHFEIVFNPELMKYYLKDLGNGFGAFIKIQSETLLRDNTLINLGDSYLVCSLGSEETINSEYGSDFIKIPSNGSREQFNMLNIKIFSGNKKYDPMNFQPTKSVIRIGRSPDCEISIDDNMLSRIHCTVDFRDNVGWIIRDGYLNKTKDGSYESKQSTNGTWMYAMDELIIFDGMIFKANHNLFECHYV